MIVKSLFDVSDSRSLMATSAPVAILLTVWLCCGIQLLAVDDAISYDQVKEILRKRCVTCHNPDEMRGDLDLKDLSAIKTGSSSGTVVVPGDPSKSLLFTTIAHMEDPAMPPNSRQLPAREQDVIRRWIAGGAVELMANVPAPNMPAAVARPATDSATSQPSALSVPAQAPGLVAIRSLPQPTAITSLDAHPTRDLAAFDGLRQAVLFEPSSGKLLGAFDVPSGEVSAVRFSANGQLLLVAAGTPAVSGKVFAFDISTGQIVWERGDETDTILALDLAPDGRLLAVGGPSKVVRLIDVATGEEAKTLKKHTDWVLTIRFSPDGMLLASGDRFGGLIVWDPQQGTLFHNLKDHTDAVHAIAWDSTSENLLSGGEDGQLRTWDMHRGQIESRWNADLGPILAIARSSQWLAAAGRQGSLSTWSVPNVPASTFRFSSQIESLVPTHDGQQIIAGNAAGQISVLNSDNLEVLHVVQLPVDPRALEQIFAKMELVSQDFASRIQGAEKIATDTKGPPMPSASSELPPSERIAVEGAVEGAVDAAASQPNASQPNASYLAEEIDLHQRQLRSLESSLQACNQSLVVMAKASADLSRALQQIAETQQTLAEQVTLQTKLLRDCQDRAAQLSAAVKKATKTTSDDQTSLTLSP